MALLILTIYVLSSCLLYSLPVATSTHQPRMTFTEKEATMKRSPLPGHHAPVRIIPGKEPDTVITAGQTHLNTFNFQHPQTSPVEVTMLRTECSGKDCNYNISVVHERKEQVFLCGTNSKFGTVCCNMNLTEHSSNCIPSENMKSIIDSIKEFFIKEGGQSALVESEDSELYITYSGSQQYVGIHKFGTNQVAPASHNKEQHYVGLEISRRDDPMQGKVYAFYKEKNRDTDLNSHMWLPFVTRVCMKDRGGPKNNMQLTWTSQLNAMLFCGDPDSKQYFSELVDVATVEAGQWHDTQVYALFRNEWGMSAMCVYTLGDIEKVITTSPFKGSDKQNGRSRECVADSTLIPTDILKKIESYTEVKDWVRPVQNSGPLLTNHHNYTHMVVDGSQKGSMVLFLSLNNGGIHKVMINNNQAFVIAEYRPFNHRAHVLGMLLNSKTRKLYVNSRHELVQMDVASCGQYGDRCEDCVLARDPYCVWDNDRCTPNTQGILQDMSQRDLANCPSMSNVHQPGKVPNKPMFQQQPPSITLPPGSKYFLECPMSSHHAQYTWHHPESNTSCSVREQQCLFLIDSMGPEQEGYHTCVSEEMGYSRVRAQFQLQLGNRAAGRPSSSLVWFCLMAVLIKSLSCKS